MAPYSELQEPVTPTYEPENSDAKDMHNDGIAPSVMVPNDLTEPILRKNSLTGATAGASDRQPRRPRRRVKSMPVNSEGAQDFFGSGVRSSQRYERHGSAPEVPDTLLLLKESESIEESAEEVAADEPIQVVKMNVRKDVKTKTDTVDAKADSTSPCSPSSSQKPVPSNQVGTECSCVIL
mmetsp:Transcript_2087/g.2893  ORF Transcript_2087/g.2893 Transcript_2087/m.2893 type:complete len:180 (+) Transcript_2087:117-656(+)|eukprot:CAMPEP_0201697628 /NCGR_PEP_ID=MMETSP0578-20130828/11427_1 /ASSEMBLY_ACC=CAM_ASM_000663 /TAXON_ID=267565 /ORGANISM="Skeletonema grethea, Strain CCMP 1804" /LENGTH=179 /DNA_ID=CAMNT_0048183833 /DNA_START=101 /DNA_END=640 /DNA_ORIENTATION=-